MRLQNGGLLTFAATFLGGLLSLLEVLLHSVMGPDDSCGVGSLSFQQGGGLRQGDGRWPFLAACTFSGGMVCR